MNSGSATKNSAFFTQVIVTRLLEIWSGMVIAHPGADYFHAGSGVKKALDPRSEPATLVGDKKVVPKTSWLRFGKNSEKYYIQGNGTSEV